MGPDDNVCSSAGQVSECLPLGSRFFQPADIIHRARKIPQPVTEGFEMLQGQNGGGDHHGYLLAVTHSLKGPTDGHFCFAETYVPAYQAVHREVCFHTFFELTGGFQLVFGILVHE